MRMDQRQSNFIEEGQWSKQDKYLHISIKFIRKGLEPFGRFF